MLKYTVFVLFLLLSCAIIGETGQNLWAEESGQTPHRYKLTHDHYITLRDLVDSDPLQGLTASQKIIDENSEFLSRRDKITLMALQSGAQARLGNFKMGLELGQRALRRSKKVTTEDYVMAYINSSIGRSFEGLGLMPEAMRAYLEANKNYQAAGERHGMASSNLNVAGLFVATKLYDKAIDEYNQALSLLNPKDDIFLYTRTLNNLGVSYVEQGLPNKAIEYLNQARELALIMGSERFISYTYENSGEAYYFAGQLEKAKEYLQLGLNMALTNGLESLASVSYHFLGLVEFAQGNYQASETHSAKAFKIAKKNDDAINLAKIYGLLSLQARHRKDYKAAMNYQDLRLQYEKTLASENIDAALALLETEFHLKEGQQKIALLERDNEIQTLSLKEEQNLRHYGFGLLIIMALCVGFLLYALHIKSETSKQAIIRERDLMESKRVAEAANRAKSEFLSYMSHELRTPLNAVIGFSETLEMRLFGSLNDKQSEYINHIHEGGQLLLKLINDLLHLSKIESGAMELDLKPCDLSNIIQDTIPLVQHLLEKNQVLLHEEVIKKNYKPVIVDKIRMDQILVNLISNAVKYGRRGGNIWISMMELNDAHLRVTVRDDGIGIAKEQFQNVFIPFNRAGMEGSGIEGTGAGLSIVKALVEAMGGIIGFDSNIGEGSIFWIDLPLVHE